MRRCLPYKDNSYHRKYHDGLSDVSEISDIYVEMKLGVLPWPGVWILLHSPLPFEPPRRWLVSA